MYEDSMCNVVICITENVRIHTRVEKQMLTLGYASNFWRLNGKFIFGGD